MTEDQRDGAREWVATGDTHHDLAVKVESKSNFISTGETYIGAALCYHFGKFVLQDFPDEYMAASQKAVVAYSQGLKLLDPTLILLDEPSMSLDPKTLQQGYETIQLMHTRSRTILLIEQNVRAGLSISTQSVVMESGQVRLKGNKQGNIGQSSDQPHLSWRNPFYSLNIH